MLSSKIASNRFRGAAITVAYRAETGIRDWLARVATSRGWTPAVLPYSGYGSGTDFRVLGRVVLAPESVDPAAGRGIPGWRRLLTLESPGTEVQIQLDGETTKVTSDEAGIIDARVSLKSPPEPGTVTARMRVGDRAQVPANINVISSEPARGLVCDIDDTAWVTGISHPLRAARRTLGGTSATRRSVPGMARLLRAAVEGQSDPAVVYLSNGPWNFVGPVSRFLKQRNFPTGAVLMTDWGITPTRWFRDGRKHKSSSLDRLIKDLPQVTWVLVGDDGEHDLAIYSDLARAHPDRVAAIALRQVRPNRSTAASPKAEPVNGVPVLKGADGDELLPLLRGVLHRKADAD
jgi:phosphatidate phosphatase APP1